MTRRSWAIGAVVFGLLANLPCRGQEESSSGADLGATTPAASRSAPAFTGRVGLVEATPYARGKIPVILIHGLWMNTTAWDEMIPALRSDADIEARFQFWTFGYATGDPIPVAAVRCRRALDEARRRHDPDRADAAFDRTVLVGHSMGGLLAKMMVVGSGDHLWEVISARPAADLRGAPADVDFIRDATFFGPRPEVGRVVFIATPHHGSRTDSGSIRILGNRLLRSSDAVLGMHRRLVEANEPDFFRPYFAGGLPSSIEELQFDGPFLRCLAELPVAAGVRSHSIIARRADAHGPTPTDGLVAVASARIAGVASEKMVTSPHLLCLRDADVKAEVRRILLEHLAAR